MNNYYRKQDFVRKYIRDLVDDGLKQMKDPNLSEDMYNIWLKYSQQVLELSTKDSTFLITLCRYLNAPISSGGFWKSAGISQKQSGKSPYSKALLHL